MSAVAYEDGSKIKDWSCDYCQKYKMINITMFYSSDKSIQGFTCYSSGLDAIIVSFRGSSNLQNWIANLNFIQTSYDDCDGCYLHQGFGDSYKSVNNYVRGEVKKLR